MNYGASLQGVDTNFQQVTAMKKPDNGLGQLAPAIAGLARAGATQYGKNKAKEAGESIGTGGESYEQAYGAVEEMDAILAAKKGGRPELNEGTALDLKNEVFEQVLTTQRRIEAALKANKITSSEANARLGVLRSKALANPLIAPFQSDLDDAMYRTTGGSRNVGRNGEGVAFGPTAAEQEAANLYKANLEGQAAAQKEMAELIHLGVASSQGQAQNIINQRKNNELKLQQLNVKSQTLGLDSEETFAKGQLKVSAVSAIGFGTIASWAKNGGKAEDIATVQGQLQLQGEQLKASIRADAFNSEGKLMMNKGTLESQLAQVDKMMSNWDDMLQDQSGTQKTVNIITEHQAKMDRTNQSIQIEMMEILPMVYATRDNPAMSDYFMRVATGTQSMMTALETSSNPTLRALAGVESKYAKRVLETAADSFANGENVSEAGKAKKDSSFKTTLQDVNKYLPPQAQASVESTLLMYSLLTGGEAVIRETMSKHPEATLDNIAALPLRSVDIRGSSTFGNMIRSGKKEDTSVVQEAIEASAARAIVSEGQRGVRRETTEEAAKRGTSRRRWSVPEVRLPASIKVTKQSGSADTGTARKSEGSYYSFDTGGVAISQELKTEIVSTWQLGSSNPQLWNDEFDSVDDWVTSLYARPERK